MGTQQIYVSIQSALKIVTSANEHQIFASEGLVFNGLWAQLADLREQIGLIEGAGWVLIPHIYGIRGCAAQTGRFFSKNP